MNKCEICKVYVECYNKTKACVWEHNGDWNICPLPHDYIDVSLHDKRIRADERAKVINEFVNALEKHQQENWIDNLEYGITFADIEEVAEQLKEQKNEHRD